MLRLLNYGTKLTADERMNNNEEIELADFLEADERLVTDGAFTLEEIAEDATQSEDPDEDDEEPSIEEDRISFVEAQRSAIIVRRYLEQNGNQFKAMKACDLIDDAMLKLRQKKMRQPIIIESFAAHQKEVDEDNLL